MTVSPTAKCSRCFLTGVLPSNCRLADTAESNAHSAFFSPCNRFVAVSDLAASKVIATAVATATATAAGAATYADSLSAVRLKQHLSSEWTGEPHRIHSIAAAPQVALYHFDPGGNAESSAESSGGGSGGGGGGGGGGAYGLDGGGGPLWPTGAVAESGPLISRARYTLDHRATVICAGHLPCHVPLSLCWCNTARMKWKRRRWGEGEIGGVGYARRHFSFHPTQPGLAFGLNQGHQVSCTCRAMCACG